MCETLSGLGTTDLSFWESSLLQLVFYMISVTRSCNRNPFNLSPSYHKPKLAHGKMTVDVVIVLLLLARFGFASQGYITSDIGGNHGWGLGFHGPDQYASVSNYFTASPYWPKQNISVSVWLRFFGSNGRGTVNVAFSMVAKGDSDHVQAFETVINSENRLSIGGNFATAHYETVTNNIDTASYWNKLTVTYATNSMGTSSVTKLYINGTKLSTTPGTGQLLRWTDSSTMILGGYTLSATKLLLNEKFVGWMDDLAFYNRVLSPNEIAATWNLAGNTSDKSMFIYYNFDEGPNAALFHNLGSVGSQANIQNGYVGGRQMYFEETSQAWRTVSPADPVPGAPLRQLKSRSRSQASLVPLTMSIDSNSTSRIRIKCQDRTVVPSSVQVINFNGKGKLFQTGSANVPGTTIKTFPTTLTSSMGELMYKAPLNQSLEAFNFTCICDGQSEKGLTAIQVLPPPQADGSLVLTVISGTSKFFNLNGSTSIGGLVRAQITALPTKGSLYQWNFSNPVIGPSTLISSPMTMVQNLYNGLAFVADSSVTGSASWDALSFRVFHDGVASPAVTISIHIQVWNYPPVIPPVTDMSLTSRVATRISLPAKDQQQGVYIGVYIKSLPTKGKLYQRLANGTKGAAITALSPNIFALSTYQFATAVLNVSSFWGGSNDWSPFQALGPQNVFLYGDSQLSWCPLTQDGTGGFSSGCANGICFANNPEVLYENYGYTEYLELGYKTPVYVTSLLIGENRGMGSIKNIKAKDPSGQWMTLYSVRKVDSSVQSLYSEFHQYRQFEPAVCGTPFATSHLRFEMDTREVPDWQEWDFFQLGGSLKTDTSEVNWKASGQWDVVYEPDPTASGLDSFSYSANDCPINALRWSPNDGVVTINIVPTGVAGTVTVSGYKATVVDLAQWSVSTTHTPLQFTVVALPSSSTLKTASGEIMSFVPYPIAGSNLTFVPDGSCRDIETSFQYKSSDPRSNEAAVTVKLNVVCPRDCDADDMVYAVEACENGINPISYHWNKTTLASQGCVPRGSVQLPAPYKHIPCGAVLPGTPAHTTVICLIVLVGCLGFVSIVWLVLNPRLTIVKLAQPGHTAAFCLGCIAFQLSWLPYLGPPTFSNCIARPWVLAVTSTAIFGFLNRKIFIVMSLLRRLEDMSIAPKNAKRTNQIHTVITMAGLWAVDAIIVGAWTGTTSGAPSAHSFEVPIVGAVVIENYACHVSRHQTFAAGLLAYKVVQILVGAAAAFRVRSIDNNVSESSMMLYSTYNYLVFIVGLAVLMITNQSQASFVLGTSVLGCFASCFSMSVLIFPKMYIHFTGKVLNVNAMFGVRKSNSNSSSDEEKSVSIPAPRKRLPVRTWDTVTGPDNKTMQFAPSYTYETLKRSKSIKSNKSNGNSDDSKSGLDGSHHSNQSGGSGGRSLRTAAGDLDGDSLPPHQSGAPMDHRVMPFSGPEMLQQDTQVLQVDDGGDGGVQLFAARSAKIHASVRSKPGPLTIDEVEELDSEI